MTTPNTPQSITSKHFWDRTFLTLRQYRNYRLVWLGSVTEHLGQWMEEAAILWLIYQMTGSAMYLALQPFMRLLPLVFLSPLGGMVSDMVDRRKLVIYTLLFKALLSVVLLVLVRMEVIGIWHIIGLALLHG